MRKIIIAAFLIALTGCNSIYVKPNTMDPNMVFIADRGGYGMQRSIKERMEERGYNVIVGRAIGNKTLDSNGGEFDSIDIDSVNTMGARYVVRVRERREWFMPYWCTFNGMWWWSFNVSIADQKTGEELLSWRGRGCANSSLRKLDAALDELEQSKNMAAAEKRAQYK